MNTVYLTQAEPLLRGAHAATIDQKQRDELRAIHSRVLKFMRGIGIFIGEIPPDKTSAPSQDEPLTPDPACPHCHGNGTGLGGVFTRCICTYDKTRAPIMDEDDAREMNYPSAPHLSQGKPDFARAVVTAHQRRGALVVGRDPANFQKHV